MLAASAAWNAAPVVVEKLIERNDWKVVERASPYMTHELTFAIKQLRLKELEETLMAVSTPGSPTFRKYKTWDEVHQMTANPTGEREVAEWLVAEGAQIVKSHKYGHYMRASANISTWERILTTTFSHKVSVDGEQTMRASKDVSVPAELAKHVDGIFGAAQMPIPQPAKKMTLKANTSGSASNGITPALLKSFYNVGSATGSGLVSQAVFESLGQYWSPSDLATFQSNFKETADPVDTDIGGHSATYQCALDPNNCAEANLDVQYMLALSPVTPMTYWYEANQNTPFEAWIEAVSAVTDPPLVNSISYGAIESLMQTSTLSTFNTEAMKLGAQGVSIFVSSGDDGVANFQARSSSSGCGYNPSFPASSPYVTAVGATQGVEDGTPEIVCASDTGGVITSGGGFSTYFSQPSYQSSAVSSYLSSVSPKPASGYDAGNRGYPDVASSGHNYEVVISGSVYLVSGTSASSPVVAAMASLVNAKLAATNSAPIGFINPTLYANPTQFNDISSGNNKCTASASVCCTEGFYATSGWDPITGFGSVDFAKFKALF